VGADHKVAIRPVQVGAPVGRDRIIREGVQAGDQVIVAGLQYARDGVTVNPTSAPVTGTGR
jgi:hypothetical protein